MSNNKGFISIIAIIVIACVALIGTTFYITKNFASPSAVTVINGTSSADPTTDYYGQFLGRLYAKNLSTGGLFSTTTTSATGTVLASSLLDARTYAITSNLVDVTLTLPASSTLSELIPNRGDRATFAFMNATSTGSIEVTMAGGVGTILSSASTTRLILSGKTSLLEFIRSATSSDIYVYMMPSGL